MCFRIIRATWVNFWSKSYSICGMSFCRSTVSGRRPPTIFWYTPPEFPLSSLMSTPSESYSEWAWRWGSMIKTTMPSNRFYTRLYLGTWSCSTNTTRCWTSTPAPKSPNALHVACAISAWPGSNPFRQRPLPKLNWRCRIPLLSWRCWSIPMENLGN